MIDDETKLKDIEQKRKNRRDQELEDIKQILDTPQGVRFFRRLFSTGSMFSTTFTGNSKTFFLEGQRNIALRFFNDVCEAAPEKISDVIIEEVDDDF